MSLLCMGSQTLLHVIHPQNSFRNLLVLRFRDLRSRSCLIGTWILVLGILFLRSTGLAVSGPVICVFHNFLFFVDRVMSLLCMGSPTLLHPLCSPKLFGNLGFASWSLLFQFSAFRCFRSSS